jgi:hypothetical protein
VAVRPETNARLTDVLGDRILSRLGNLGNELLSDLLDKFHSALGVPFETTPSTTPDSNLHVSAGVYTLPDQRRLAPMRGGTIPSISAADIDFQLGSISTGAILTFVLPNMMAGNYIKALIQYSYGTNAFDVTFGSQNVSLSGAGTPIINVDFEPVCLVELHSTVGGVGSFDVIGKTNLILVMDSMDYEPAPIEETHTVVVDQDVFTLTTIKIPSSRSRLMVFINGVYQILGTHYNVTSDTVVTFTSPVFVNAEVLFRVV